MWLLQIAVLTACDGSPSDSKGAVDGDGDGTPAWLDCDDADADVHPGAAEYCGGDDHDCDGLVDDDDSDTLTDDAGRVTVYLDLDGDGYGEDAVALTTCTPPEGFVGSGGDCADGDAETYPGAPERCDDWDNDCDGIVDGSSASDATAWYADTDADGFGDPAVETIDCTAPEGFVADATDCDDLDPNASPDGVEVCDGIDQDCDGTPDDDAVDRLTWYLDADADGFGDADSSQEGCTSPAQFVPDATDCDDANALVNPGMTELCAGGDEDCDGLAGDDDPDVADPVPFYADADGDGFGLATIAVSACLSPAGFASGPGDCDDTDPGASPAGVESCGAADEDCDGLVNDADPSVLGAPTWWGDADGDGYGDPAVPTNACEAPAGSVADASDCDDSNAASHPGGVEVCASGDEDCDSLRDDADPDVSDASTWYPDADGDGSGDADSFVVACVQPTGSLTDGTDCDDTDPGIHLSAPETCEDGVDQDCILGDQPCTLTGDYSLASADVRITGGSGNMGYNVSAAGDVDGDGRGDVLIGAWEESTAGSQSGGAYLVRAPSGTMIVGTDAALLTGIDTGDHAGVAVAGVGDIDGDGLSDIMVGAYFRDPDFSGAAYFFSGATLPAAGTATSLSTADLTLGGIDTYDYAGNTLADAGDLDGDGIDDVLIGSTGDSSAGYHSGATYVVSGARLPTLTGFAAADAMLLGEDSGAHSAGGLDSAGDFDGDGIDDALIGAEGEHSGGALAGGAYVVLGPISGTLSLGVSDAKFVGESSGDLAGSSVAGVGDTDGDGYDDILVGAPYTSRGGYEAGAAFFVRGNTLGEGTLGDADAIFDGEVGSQAGKSVAGPGDLDGDGYDDLVVGAWRDSTLGYRHGGVYVAYGPVSGVTSVADMDAHLVGDNGAGYSVAGAGDTDGDGLADLLIGAPWGSRGMTYLVYGRAR